MQFGIMKPPQAILDEMRATDEAQGIEHDIAWDGSIVIDHKNRIWWIFVDSVDMKAAVRPLDDEPGYECMATPFVSCGYHEHLHDYFAEHIEPDPAMFMAEGGPSWNEA